MGADAGYLSLIQHNDALGMHDTGNTLRHQQNRTSGFLTQFVQCLSQAGICFEIQCGEGIIKDDIEETIKSMGYIGRVGMRATDTEILNVMIDRADINEEC